MLLEVDLCEIEIADAEHCDPWLASTGMASNAIVLMVQRERESDD